MQDLPHSPNLLARQADHDEAGWYVYRGLALHEMEQLLDWLEQCRCDGCEVQVDLVEATVRWRPATDRGSGS